MAQTGVVNEIVLSASAAQTASFQGTSQATAVLNRIVAGTSAGTQMGATFLLDCTTSSGTSPTCKVAIQGKGNYASASWYTLPGAQFQMITSSANATTAQQAISYPYALPPNLRAVGTLGGTTPSFTLAVVAEALG